MKIGLCLSGGGSRGAYQIGACKALEEAGIYDKIKAFSGASIGSVNAVLLASSSIEDAKQAWFDLSDEALKSTESFFKRLKEEKLEYIHNGIYQIDTLKNNLEHYVNVENLREKEVYVTISLAGEKDGGLLSILKSSFKHYIRKDSQVVYAPVHKEDKENVYKQVLASCSIPIVFPPTIIGTKQFVDGGLYDNVPVKPLVEAGCDVIIVIHLYRLPYFYAHKYSNVSFYSLKPKHSLGGMLNFNKDNAKLRYHQGYLDMKEFLDTHKII